MVDKSGAFAPTYPQLRWGNQTYVVLAKAVRLHVDFMFSKVHINQKKQRGPFKVLDLKTVFSDFCRQKLDLWVDFNLSFTLVISQFIQRNFQRKMSDQFFWLFYSNIFWLFYYIFAFSQFKRCYYMNDRLDFILTVIKRYYNSNDRLKFVLLFIRWQNNLNKMVKARQKGVRKTNEMKIKARETSGDH